MQSDWNSFCGDVVLNSFNMAYRDEDRISYQNYEKLIFWDLYYKILNFKSDLRKYIFKDICRAHNNKELIKLEFSAIDVLVCIFV